MKINKLTIKVTQKHINLGVGSSLQACPIALALRGLGLRHVTVADTLHFSHGPDHYVLESPTVAKKFMSRFDLAKKVKPFQFTVRLGAA